MKIKSLKIKNYKQFGNLELDLTYPKGHKKSGQPLDKICIIGQSGTGKTNLLKIIIDSIEKVVNKSSKPFKSFYDTSENKYVDSTFINKDDITLELACTDKGSKTSSNSETIKKEISSDEKCYFLDVNKFNQKLSSEKDKELKDEMTLADKKLLENLMTLRAKLTFKDIEESITLPKGIKGIQESISYLGYTEYPSIKAQIKEVNNAIFDLEDKYQEERDTSLQKIETVQNKKIYNLTENDISWEILKKRIENYDKEKTLYKKQLFDKIIHDTEYSKEDSIEEIRNWELQNENILARIADDINSIIRTFNLQLQIDEYTNSYDELIIQDLSNKNILKYEVLSTGTKNLISTLIPLKSYNPKNSIILIDEPENSFYPDIQRQLTDLYMNVGENNQLIMATHSPLIASSFEPWEVVELKFDNNNQVYRELYYDDKNDENHIDNYFINPQLLTWTGILTDVFDLKEDSNFTFREKKLMEYATLKANIKVMNDSKEKEKAFMELKKISKLLGLYS